MKTGVACLLGLILLCSCGGLNHTARGADEDSSGCTTCEKAEQAMQARRSRISAAQNWLYLLDIDYSNYLVVSIADSNYDVIVMDYLPSQVGQEDFDLPALLESWHTSSPERLVLAYVDIGEAESYRTYWQTDWKPGNPEWILQPDGDGWQDNFYVAFWHTDWKKLWLDEQDGLLKEIMEAGYDGIYLDNLEIYSQNAVLQRAAQEHRDVRSEITALVINISNFCHDREDNFLIVGQNALELLQNEKYACSLDAVAQEHIWFDGGSDNDPPGDCPLPATPQDIDSVAYIQALPDRCRAYYQRDADGSLHTSSAEYLVLLQAAVDNDLPVMTVDYALREENIATAIENSRHEGFIPFVGSRMLNSYQEAPSDAP